MRVESSADSLWWLAVGFISFSSLGLPNLLKLETGPGTETLLIVLALFLTGAVVGCLRPVRAWRWGLAAALGFAVSDLMGFVTAPQFIWSSGAVAQHLAQNAPPSFVHAAPVLVGAYLGSYLMQG